MKTQSRLSQQNTLRMHLSPQQVRFVRLLEMSGPEIEDAVRNELDENPALEAEDEMAPSGTETASDTDADEFHESAEQMQAADYGNEDDVPQYLLHASRETDLTDPGSHYPLRQWPSMVEWLNEQLDTIDAPERDIAIARYLIGYLDNNGRLTRRLGDIADDIAIATGHEVSRADLIPALDIIRYQLDPPGLGAVDLRECLLIQLRRIRPKTLVIRVAEEIIDQYFDLFAKKRYDRLKTALGVTKDVLDGAIETIRSLDPKPGGSLSDGEGEKAAHITPDFIVTPVEDETGRFSVTLNQHIPELAIEQSFKVDSPDPESRLFIRRKREEATTFIGLLKRRSDTLMAVMKAIVNIQHRFFETEDVSTLRPMILEDVSRHTGYDRSVISRATSGKYVATQGGTYPLKMFFNDTPTDDADTSSSEIVAALQKLIDNEDKRRPLSDQALTDALNEQGYRMARRTVTKYREKNNIPVARLRKEY